MKDKELETLIKKKKQQKWLELFMLMSELEETLKNPITYFEYTPNYIWVEDDKNGCIGVSL